MARVLLLTASFGDGHNQAAFAVAEALAQGGDVVKVVDYVEWLHPAVRSFAKFSLLQGVQKAPALYGLFYRSMSRIHPTSSLQRQLNHLGMSHMKRWLAQFRPDVVASTFPTPTGVLSELRGMQYTSVRSAAIVTDYTAHRQWVQVHTDAYFVASDSVKQELLAYGVPEDRIFVTGIPVRSRFGEARVEALRAMRDELRRRHGLRSDQPLILMMGGGAGLFGDMPAWEQVMQDLPAQFVIICGHNDRLQRKLAGLASERIRVLGYTQNVDEWMAMADLLITKAGGITVTEALAMGLPMLLYRPIPGQERENARFVIRAGAARLAEDVRSATQILQELVSRPDVLADMRRHALAQHVHGGAERIAAHLRRLAQWAPVQESPQSRRDRIIPRFS
ncbi:galactosyldiacylglycerol synthase [Alicyclobacillus cellulosilyticus]|uniref:Galactosyldiacylglycerol synthase n=1 Tax=Alicyclobacillus cellulosilyticus TaxID=1003997 RepID=A0A917NLM8_9BACL|nr:glycosyltransferase [Alicyclobacillus cellulosilyticus]GGJ09904.1 galactosyldiacylglycerol synthase [Alicyclobacillus cellulosilyticus]